MIRGVASLRAAVACGAGAFAVAAFAAESTDAGVQIMKEGTGWEVWHIPTPGGPRTCIKFSNRHGASISCDWKAER